MKKLVIIFSLILPLMTAVEAMWVKLSGKDLLDSSQLIVNATLKDDLVPKAGDSRLGVLQIIRVYQGQPGGEEVYLKLPAREKPVSSSDLVYPVGRKVIWFLKESDPGSGVFYLDHPQRLWPLEDEPMLLDMLKQRVIHDNEAK